MFKWYQISFLATNMSYRPYVYVWNHLKFYTTKQDMPHCPYVYMWNHLKFYTQVAPWHYFPKWHILCKMQVDHSYVH